MSTEQRTNGRAVATIAHDLAAMRPELEKALRVRGIDVDYFARVVRTTCQKTPKLLECDRRSLLAAITESAQLGLIPDPQTGYGYLIPRWNGRLKLNEAHFMPGYKGFVQLAYRGGKITKIVGREVCERDDFRYVLGTEETIEHVPAMGDRGAVTHFYAIAWQTDGPPIFVVLPRSRVDDIRARVIAQNRGKEPPSWAGDYAAMGRKTAVRELFRWLPLDPDAHRAASRDEAHERGEDIDEPREVEVEVRRSPIEELIAEDEDVKPDPAESDGSDDAEPEFVTCDSCSGSGVYKRRDGEEVPCSDCLGSGDVPASKGGDQ